ncbi:hypothetical protein GPECTOR_126g523 [Gonium pectorale]|uniref:cellulase n=1 Tax=Gonium pectorale TaxID=33097 RepID=A0A150FYK9_GONPE|nr:hypothetical protein GPECTOR_126g523 [Gonium pectorale]|eukprot:KXZ42667.1 hypothetical protein GPECTOR_126g523 [Gonium pectorale]
MCRFYEAQMSGSLPPWSRVAKANSGGWRSPGHLQDGQGPDMRYYPNKDLTGGWYENGGYLKVSLTQGATASLLAYSALTWENAARAAGQWDVAVRNVGWVAAYLYKCHYAADTFVAQIGDLTTDDMSWASPESAPEAGSAGSPAWRPVWAITAAGKRGADVVSQAVATLAAAALMLTRDGPSRDAVLAADYIAKAQELHEMAMALQGVYIVPEGNITVLSRSYKDDQTWATAWMCRWQLERGSSGLSRDYCAASLAAWDAMTDVRGEQPQLSSDAMHLAAALLLRDLAELAAGKGEAFGSPQYVNEFEAMADAAYARWKSAESNTCESCADVGLCRTPGGFMVLYKYGSAHYTANMALAMLASAPRPGEALKNERPSMPASAKGDRQCWAWGQISYLLGANSANQAYVVGLTQADGLPTGVSSPTRPRHRASSCSGGPGCSGPQADSRTVLAGALVGGPSWDDSFANDRDDIGSAVSIEYNAGFNGALLGLSAIEAALARFGRSWVDFCDDPSDRYEE